MCQLNRHHDWLTCYFRARDASRVFSIPKFLVFRKPGTSRKYIRTHHHLKIATEASVFIDYVGGATSRLIRKLYALNSPQFTFLKAQESLTNGLLKPARVKILKYT